MADPTYPGLVTPVFGFNFGWPQGTKIWNTLADANWPALEKLLALPGFTLPTATTIGLDGAGRIHTLAETIAGKTRTTTVAYKLIAGQTVVDTVTVVINGTTRTVTYEYDATAALTGASMRETHA